MKQIKVGILGATGIVGQNYIRLLEDHPWFEVTYIAASPASAGKRFEEAVRGRWHMSTPIPKPVGGLEVADAGDIQKAVKHCRFVFSAIKLDKTNTKALEDGYAAAGLPVVSNNSAHRGTADVPVFIPEINAHHTEIIPIQQKARGWDKGFIVVKPNCSVQSYLMPVFALLQAGYEVKSLVVTLLQAVSGSGHPGVASLDILDNIIPLISGEEEKSEIEPLKILGDVSVEGIRPYRGLAISAHCTRVPVLDGHTACVGMSFAHDKPDIEEITAIWEAFSGRISDLDLPSAPNPAIHVRKEADRPQPRKDRDAGNGMAISVGRLRPCNVMDYRFVGLSHNTVRGAAGGGILNAELLAAKGFFE